jgi:predicted RNA-binding Zn-ribbon protein involved in translation (DUF1610 family)
MILIWGSRGLTSEIGRGNFYCPQCDAVNVPYRHKSVREWFTLYFIPVFPIGGKQPYVECEQCKGTFQEAVLNLEPPTEGERMAQWVATSLDDGISLEEAEERLVEFGLPKETAREFVESLAGKDPWMCPKCGEHYKYEVRRCRTCHRKEKLA